MKSPKVDTSGQKAAAQAAAEAQAAANNLQKNFAADLKTNNLTEVVAAGTADNMSTVTDNALRKRKPAAGLSTQLGLNV